MDPKEIELSEEMIPLAESDSFDVFTDSQADLVHLDCYSQGITMHLLKEDFLELVKVLKTAADRLGQLTQGAGGPPDHP